MLMSPRLVGVDSGAPNGLELSCPAEAGTLPLIVAQAGGPRALPYGPARRVSFSELLGCTEGPRLEGISCYGETDAWASHPSDIERSGSE